MFAEIAHDDVRSVGGCRVLRVHDHISANLYAPTGKKFFQPCFCIDGPRVEQSHEAATLVEVLVYFFKLRIGDHIGGPCDNQEVAICRHGISAEQGNGIHLNVVLLENGCKLCKTEKFISAIHLVLPMAGEEKGLEWLEIGYVQQRRG